MWRVLIDSNVLLDVLLRRDPWQEQAMALWQAHVDSEIQGYVCATSFTNLFYIIGRVADEAQALTAVSATLNTFAVAPVTRQTLLQADASPGTDFEDNVQIACAELLGLQRIITRDQSGFVHSSIRALTPQAFLAQLNGNGD